MSVAPDTTRAQRVQYEFTAHLRDPAGAPAPAGIEDRRLAVYRELVFTNMESFISSNCPVIRSLCDDARGDTLAREFLRDHRCHTPLFPEFAREFLRYILARREQGRDDLEELVEDARHSGAEVLCGGHRLRRPELPGWYYPPTVLAGITREMRIHREEAFGPVATLYRAADLDEAVLIANDSPFGLSSNVWTRDETEVDRFVRDLEAGGVFFNGMTASHPAFPFGGVKRSGYGRELSGHGIREFCNITTVWHGA